jgi:hypothetical protein
MQNNFCVISVVCGYLLNRHFKKLLGLELILPIQGVEIPQISIDRLLKYFKWE